MKILFKIACIFALMPGLVVACTNSDPDTDPEPLDAPAGLEVVNLTITTASLSWQTVKGAKEYNVVIGEGAPVKAATASYEASGLSSATTYKWKVQAVNGNVVSEWADGPDFTTETEVVREQFVHAEVYAHNGDCYGSGTENFTIDFCDYDPHGADLNGIRLTLDFIFGQELDMDPAKAILDLPAGTYEINTTKGVNTIYSKQSGVLNIVNGNDSGSYTMVESGTMTIAGDHTGYTMTFDIILSGGGELHADYTGPFEMANPYCLPPIEVEFVDVTYQYLEDIHYGPGTSNFTLRLTPFVQDRSGDNTGKTGWWTQLDIVSVAVDESPEREYLDIGTGTYTFSSSKAVNTLNNVLTNVAYMENGDWVDPVPKITSGTMTISGDHTGYTMSMSFILDDHRTFTATYNGAILVKNPCYTPPVEGVGELVKAEFTEWPPAVDGVMNYMLTLYDSDYSDTGTGYALVLDLYIPSEIDSIIPDGTYTVGDAINTADGCSGYWRFVDGCQTDVCDWLESGTVSITRTGEGTYTIVMDILTQEGLTIKQTYSGAVTYNSIYGAPMILKADSRSHRYVAKPLM